MKEINYDALIANIDEMINLHEYDGMRSAGKIRVNAETLNTLHLLRERYLKMKKPNTRKEG